MVALPVLALCLFYPAARLQSAAADTLDYFLSLGDHDHNPQAPLQFYAPQGVTYDSSGRLFASDTQWDGVDGNRVKVFGANNAYLFDALPASPFSSPVGLAVDANGVLVVADGDNSRLVFFNTTATEATEIADAERGTFGGYDPLFGGLPSCPMIVPDADCQGFPRIPLDVLNYPTGLSLKPGTLLRTADTTGRLAVADTGNHRVVVYNSQLDPIYQIGGHVVGVLDDPLGTLEYPFGVAIDAAGLIYVADTDNSRVQVFREVPATETQPVSAEFVRVFGSQFVPETLAFSSSPGDLSRPYGLSFDSAGRLLVTDTDNHRILRIDVTTELSPTTILPACEFTESSQVEAYCQITTSDNKRYSALVLGTRGDQVQDGAGTEALFKFPQGIAESPLNRTIAVADTDNQMLQLFRSALLSLNFTGVPAIDPGPYALNQPLQFSVSLINDGAIPVTASVSAAANSLGTMITPAPAVLAAGQAQLFTFTFTPAAPIGALTFTVAASGTADVMVGRTVNVGSQTINGGAVASAIGLSVSSTASVAAGGVGDPFSVTVQLTNTGPATLTNVSTAIQIDQPTLIQQVGPSPSVATLPPLGTANLTYNFTMLVAGTVTLTASGSAQYINQSFAQTAAPLTLSISNDAQPPVSTISLPLVPASGWYNTPITINLSADDNTGGSGVASIRYRVVQDNIVVTVPGSVAQIPNFLRQGSTEIRNRAQDNAGNVETERGVVIKQDSIAPDMGAPQVSSATPITNGWYRTPPTVTFVAGEGAGGSGLATITGPSTITTNGASQSRTGVAVDNAGNQATHYRDANGNSVPATATVHVDQLAPSVVCTPRTPANLFGWYTAVGTTVTVDCVGIDQAGLSGLAMVTATCGPSSIGSASITPVTNGGYLTGPSAPTMATCTVSGQGDHTVLAEAADQAGNTIQTTIRIKIDWTPPTVSCDTASGGDIWPPNHQWVLWNTVVQVTDALVPNLVGSSVAGFKLKAYGSSENITALGSGHTTADLEDMKGWETTLLVRVPTAGVTSGYVRAERSGPGTGRIYRLLYEGRDLAGNFGSCLEVLTQVPHDQGKKT